MNSIAVSMITVGGLKLRFFLHLILKDENILFNSTEEKHISKFNVLFLNPFIKKILFL